MTNAVLKQEVKPPPSWIESLLPSLKSFARTLVGVLIFLTVMGLIVIFWILENTRFVHVW